VTKLWRKREWEETDKELEADPDFHWFIKDMYRENTEERQREGRTPFLNMFEYYRTYPGWLKARYENKKLKDND